jgi:streptogramin lyase
MKSKFILLMAWIILQACQGDPEPAIENTKTSGNPLDFTEPSGTIVTIAGKGPSAFGYTGNGDVANEAELDFVTSVSVDQSGDVYISCGASNTIRKIYSSNGIIETYAGVFLGWNVVDPTPLQGDNGPAFQAHLNFPLAIHIDKNGNTILLDAGNQLIREIRKSDSTIHKLAGGNSWTDYSGDDGSAASASFNNPYSVTTDALGNIYVADQYNHAIRKIDRTTGIITTIAGKGPDHPGYSGDNGPATSAALNAPKSVTVDNNGSIYISDTGNHVIRKISNGTITTIAGNGTQGYSGDGAIATNAMLDAPQAITVDGDGNIYFVDGNNNVIRKVDNTGVITTYAGTGTSGYTGDGGPATQATIANPWGIATDGAGNLYIADTNNAAIRVVIK